MSDKPKALTAQELQSLRNLGNEYEAAADEITRLRPLTFCGCGDQFSAHDPGTCGACVAGGNTGLHIEIDRLHAECERLRAALDNVHEEYGHSQQQFVDCAEECERLRAVLSESADFWAHYSSLNESEQDELNQQRHETLAGMRNAINGV